MNRFLAGLIACVLVMAIGAPVMALDVKFAGQAEMAGYWESNRAMASSNEQAERYYTSFIRIEPVFQIAEGLSLVTRFEGLERVAGLQPVGGVSGVGETANGTRNSTTEQNFAMKRGYISAKIFGGTLDVGYMGGGRTGTVFLDYDADVFRVRYTYATGPWQFQVYQEKVQEDSIPNNTISTTQTFGEADKDKYVVNAVYKWTGSEVGSQITWYLYNDKEQAATHPYRANYYLLTPWFKMTFGPLYVEGEVDWYFGKAYDYLNTADQNKNYSSFNWYLMGKYTMGPGYVGAQVARVQGQDPTSIDVQTASAPAGQGYVLYQPTLVLWNDWTNRWTTQGLGTTTGTFGSISSTAAYYVNNTQLYQVMAGYKPLQKLSLDAAFTMAWADQKPSNYQNDKYGNEFDIKATYKFYDNLSYMLAFGYLWTGDYFKGTAATNQVGDDWLLMHKLTLNF